MRSHDDRKPVTEFKFPRFVLVWKPAAVPQVKWHGQLAGLAFREMPRRLHIYFSVRGTLLWSTGALLTVYFVGTATLAYVWGRNPYNHIAYTDLALPSHWAKLREKRGQGEIDQGIHEIRMGSYAGVMLLNHGLSLQPADWHGRMVLAQVFTSMGYLHRGQQLLEAGLAFGSPPKLYREALFRLTTYLEDYERLLELADQIEKTLPANDTAAHRWLLAQRVTALEKLHRYDEIERLRGTQSGSPSFALEAAWARVQVARGRPADALREIASDPGRFGVPIDRYQLQLALAVAAHDATAAHEAVQAWLKEEPTQPQPWIQEISACIQLGDAKAAHAHLQDFFLHFGSQKPAVILLFKKMCDLPELEWLQAARDEAAEAGAMSIEAHMAYVQGLLMAGKVSAALAEFNLTTALIAQSKINDGGWGEGTRRLLAVLLSDSPSSRSQFLEFFRNNRLTPDAYRFALKSLHNAGATGMMGELAIIARNRFPAFQSDTLQPTPTIVTTKPGETNPDGLRNEAEARMELRRLDEELLAGSYQPAFSRLKMIESAGFPALKAELLMRRIRLQGALDDQSDLTAALQLYLSGPEVSQAWLSQLARQWTETQQKDSALTVARETHAKFPQARWAMELLNLPATDNTSLAKKTPAPVRTEAEARVELRLIDETLAAGRYGEALERIKVVERAGFTSLKQELLLRRIQTHGSLREQTELAAALGYYLSGQSVDQTALHTLAIQWDNEQQRDSALSLLRETITKFPQARWALELRKKIEGDLLIAPEKNLLEPPEKR